MHWWVKSLGVACLTAGFAVPAAGQSTSRYFYDDRGQLVKVVDPAGEVAEYVYDPAGNIQEIKRYNVGGDVLAVFSVTPQRGMPGTPVRIEGQGFAATPASNVVRFTGTLASVATAAANALEVLVPPAAVSGPITVSVGDVSVSAGHFEVLSLPPPSITSVRKYHFWSPALRDVQVTGDGLTGAHFTVRPEGSVQVTSAVIETGGTAATLHLAATTTARGVFLLLATNERGQSDTSPSPANTFVILDPDPSADTDSDGLTNGDEFLRGTDPLNPDTDGDRFADAYEVLLQSDPLDPASKPQIPVIVQEAATATFSLRNVGAPPPFNVGETASAPFAVMNAGRPPGAETAEAVSPPISIENSGPPVSSTPLPGEVAAQPWSTKNTSTSAVNEAEAGSPPLGTKNQ